MLYRTELNGKLMNKKAKKKPMFFFENNELSHCLENARRESLSKTAEIRHNDNPD